MAITFGGLKAKVLAILNKQSGYQGFFTTEKLNDAVNDSIDWCYANMMFVGKGWQSDILYVTTTPATESYTLNPDIVTIDAVRYKVGDTYQILKYDDGSDSNFATSGQTTGYPSSYRIVDNSIFFNPIPTQVGTDFLQIEFSWFRPDMATDGTVLNSQFTKGLENYIKWRSCSILVSQIGKPNSEWQRFEDEWYTHLKQLASQRVRQTRFMGGFREGWA